MRFIATTGKMKAGILFLACFAGILAGCNNLQGKTKTADFYTADREADLYRIPLIEPLQLVNTGFIEDSWFFELPDSLPGMADDQIAVDAVWVDAKDSLVALYAKSIYLPGEMTEAWFLFDMPGKTARYFKSEQEFNRETGQKAKFTQCATVYTAFSKTGKLPWR